MRRPWSWGVAPCRGTCWVTSAQLWSQVWKEQQGASICPVSNRSEQGGATYSNWA